MNSSQKVRHQVFSQARCIYRDIRTGYYRAACNADAV